MGNLQFIADLLGAPRASDLESTSEVGHRLVGLSL